MRSSDTSVHPQGLPTRLAESRPGGADVEEVDPGTTEGDTRVIQRRKRGPAKPKAQPFRPMTSRFRLRKKATTLPQSLTRVSHSGFQIPFPGIGQNGGLDPFLPLPVYLTNHDRELLQYYLISLPRTWYGHSDKPVFSVVRDVSLHQGMGSEIFLAWMLFAAEASLKKPTQEENDALLASRRASNYRMMRKLLEDPRNQYLDSTIADLAVAGSAELRLGSITLARQHLAAALNLLGQRRGLRTLQEMTGTNGMTTSHVFHMTGIPMIFDDPKVFSQALSRCGTALREMLTWNISQRKEWCWSEPGDPHLQTPESQEEGGSSSTAMAMGETYWSTRKQCLGPSSALGSSLVPGCADLLQAKSAGLPEATIRCQAGNLYSLNSMLYNLRNDAKSAQDFLVDLGYIVQNSCDTTAKFDAAEKVIPARVSAAMVTMIAHCASRHGHWLDADWKMTLPALRIWESIEFVELIMLASQERRQHILNMMYSWLCCDVEDLDVVSTFGEKEL